MITQLTRPGRAAVLLFVLGTGIPLAAAPAKSGVQSDSTSLVLTLDKAIEIALQQNRDVLIAGQDRIKATAQEREAWSGVYPQVNVSGSYNRNIKKQVLFIPPNSPINPTNSTAKFELGSDNSYSAGASLTQPLFSWKTGVALDIAETYAAYADRGVEATEQGVTREVKKAFYGILLAQQLVEANRRGLEVVRANLENIRAQYTHGTAAEFDLLRAEVQLANTEPLLISSEHNLTLAMIAMKNLLALPRDQAIVLRGEFAAEEVSPATLDAARAEAIGLNPTLAQLSLQETLLDQNISIVKAAYYPSLNLVGSYMWQTQDNTFRFKDYNWANMLSVGVTLSYTLFDGFATSARAQQAVVDREKVHFTRLKAEEGVRIQIQTAELRMAEARKRIAGQEKSVAQAQRAVQIAQTRFTSGVGTQLELLDTQVAMTRAQTNYAQAIYDYLLARADWHYAVGRR